MKVLGVYQRDFHAIAAAVGIRVMNVAHEVDQQVRFPFPPNSSNRPFGMLTRYFSIFLVIHAPPGQDASRCDASAPRRRSMWCYGFVFGVEF